jgi:hypothetical protein
MSTDARRPDAATLAREALFICQPDGFTAVRCTAPFSHADLAVIGWERVVFKAVLVRPYVCPVNGAELGDEPYWTRLPHRSDGMRLRFD